MGSAWEWDTVLWWFPIAFFTIVGGCLALVSWRYQRRSPAGDPEEDALEVRGDGGARVRVVTTEEGGDAQR